MAGARVHKFGSILKRTEGLLKAKALSWEERPLWYDVMKRFPPKVEPDLEQPISNEPVRKILYPEDIIRAKFYEEFIDKDVVNLKADREDVKVQSQLFVEAYLKHRKPDMTVDEILQAAETELNENSKQKLVRKKTKFHVEPAPDVDEVDTTDVEKPSRASIRRERTFKKSVETS